MQPQTSPERSQPGRTGAEMTAPARITQADMDRAAKAVKAAKIERARIIMDLNRHTIEIIIGEAGNDSPPVQQWSDDDV